MGLQGLTCQGWPQFWAYHPDPELCAEFPLCRVSFRVKHSRTMASLRASLQRFLRRCRWGIVAVIHSLGDQPWRESADNRIIFTTGDESGKRSPLCLHRRCFLLHMWKAFQHACVGSVFPSAWTGGVCPRMRGRCYSLYLDRRAFGLACLGGVLFSVCVHV